MAAIMAHIISSAADIMKRTNATISNLYDRLASHYASRYERCGKEKMCLAFSVALALFNEALAGNMLLLHFDESVCVHGSEGNLVYPESGAAKLTFYIEDNSFYIYDDDAWMKNAIWDSFLLIADNMDGPRIAQCFYDYANHYQLFAFSVESGYVREQRAQMVSPQDVVVSQMQASIASQNRKSILLGQLMAARQRRDEHRRKAEEETRKAEEEDRVIDNLTTQILCEQSNGTIINNFLSGNITNQGTITGNVI